MGMKETLKLLITGDGDGAVKAFEKVGKAADRDLNKAEQHLDQVGARMTKMGAASVAASVVAVAALSSTIDAASDLNEAVNVAGLTFGDSADEMEEWAEGAAKAFGQSKRQALEGAAAIGGLLKNVGFLEEESADLSKQLVVLSSDMASAFNMEPADALAALRSGLAGESEPLKRFNVFLNEAAVKTKALELGLYDGKRALTDNEKAQARLAIITEQTADIQGDFANTADGAANAQRVFTAQLEDAKASIGQAVLPIFQSLLGLTNDIFGAFNSLPGPVKTAIGQMAVVATALGGTGGAALLAAGQLIKMRETMVKLNATRLTGVIGALGKLAGAIGIAYAAWQILEDSTQRDEDWFESIETGAKAIQSTLDDATGAMSDFTKEQLAAQFATSGIADAMTAAGLSVADFDRATRGGRATQMEFRQALQGTGKLSDEQNGQLTDLILSYERGIELWGKSAAVMSDVEEASAVLGAVQEDTARGTDGVARSFAGLNDGLETTAIDQAADAMDRLRNGIDGYFSSITAGLSSQADFEGAIDNAFETLNDQAKNGITLDDIFNADESAGRDNIKNLETIVGAINDQTQAMIDAGATREDVKAKQDELIQRLQDEATEYGISEEAIGQFVDKVDEIPLATAMQLELEGYDEVMARLKGIKTLVDDLRGTTPIRVPAVGDRIAGARADGGPVKAGEPYLVGERGPELMVPDVNGEIVPHEMLARAASGGGSSATQPENVTHVTAVVQIDKRDVAVAASEGSLELGGLPWKLVGER